MMPDNWNSFGTGLFWRGYLFVMSANYERLKFKLIYHESKNVIKYTFFLSFAVGEREKTISLYVY